MAVPQASVPFTLPFTLLLGVLLALTALGMDMFLPSVPVIAQAFGAEPGAAQLCVTTYPLGCWPAVFWVYYFRKIVHG